MLKGEIHPPRRVKEDTLSVMLATERMAGAPHHRPAPCDDRNAGPTRNRQKLLTVGYAGIYSSEVHLSVKVLHVCLSFKQLRDSSDSSSLLLRQNNIGIAHPPTTATILVSLFFAQDQQSIYFSQ